MKKQTSSVRKTLTSTIKSLLYSIWRYETPSDRKNRVCSMQYLLDTEHRERLGWTCR